MRTAIATDSNSGITQEQAAKLGIYVLPMPFMINGEMFYEGVNLTHEEFFKRMEEGADITTSQPSPGEVTDFWDKLLKEYDEILYIPMSSGLSGSCASAAALAEDYDGKVVVVNNQRISVTQKQAVRDAVRLAEEGHSMEDIHRYLMDTKFDSTIYITVDISEKGRSCDGGRRSYRHGAEHQAGTDDPGGEAGRLCQGQRDESGQKTDDRSHG